MIKIFSKLRIIFYFINLFFIILYIYPGSLLGLILYNDKRIQPQITPDFIISSNHLYAFVFISILGFLSFVEVKQKKYLVIYLILLSLILEIFHLIIPERSFQWSDLFGNLMGVFIVILLKNLINKYGNSKK